MLCLVLLLPLWGKTQEQNEARMKVVVELLIIHFISNNFYEAKTRIAFLL